MVSSISLSDEKEAFLTRCECELSFGHSGAAVMAVGCSASNVYSASCAGILVGGSHGRPDMWLLGVQTILQVLNTVRFLPNMSLAQPDEDMVRKAEQEYGFFCMEIPEKEQLSLQPYSETSKHMTPAIVELTAVMIGEFDADRVIKRRNKESIRKIGSRSSVKAAIQAYSNQPKVQDKIEDTTRFDYGESQGDLTFIVLQPRSPMFHDYRALAARLKSDNTTGLMTGNTGRKRIRSQRKTARQSTLVCRKNKKKRNDCVRHIT
ncbi:hypothetical protein WJX79_001050 [Trebouxia sp. C0005]